MPTTNTPHTTSDNRLKISIGIISVLLVALNITRIINIPLTYDESCAHAITTMPWSDIIHFKTVSANNQILNTLSRKFFVEAFSDTPFWLRIDSLLAQLVFLWYAYLLCKKLFATNTWRIYAFLLLNLHPLMFEFWGLSRGYGLAIAFMTGSVYYLLCYTEGKKTGHLLISLLFAIIAVYSNFTLVDYYCGIVFFLIVKPFIPTNDPGKNKLIIKEAVSVIVASAVLYLLIACPIQKLIQEHQLYHGGDRNIVSDTIMSLIRENNLPRGLPVTALLHALAIFIVLSTATIGIYWCISWVRKAMNREMYTGLLLWILLIAPGIIIIAQHFLFHTLYPIDRTVMFFIPLYILAFTYWLYYMGRGKSIFSIAALYTIMALVVANFAFNMNITKTRMWYFDANTLVVLNRIENETKNQTHKNRICAHWLLMPSMNYYIETVYSSHFESLVHINDLKPGEDTTFDYYYITAEDLNKIPKNYMQDTSFFNNEYYLFRKNSIPPYR